MAGETAIGQKRQAGNRRRNCAGQAGLDHPEHVMAIASRYSQHANPRYRGQPAMLGADYGQLWLTGIAIAHFCVAGRMHRQHAHETDKRDENHSEIELFTSRHGHPSC